MPTVRRAERTQTIGQLPGVRKTAAATAASEGAGAELALGRAEAAKFGAEVQRQEAIGQFGAMVTRVGAAMFADISEKERQAANQTALINADNRLSDWRNKRMYDAQSGAMNLRGKDALPLPEQIREEYNQVANEIEGGLSNDEQRAAFMRLRSQTWQGLDLEVRRHTFKEMNEYRAGELKTFLSNSVNAAQHVAHDPKLVQVELSKAVSAIRTQGPTMGMGPEMIDAQVRAVTSQTHTSVIDQLLADGNDKAASAYFEAAGGQIEGDKLDAVKKALEEGSLRGESQRKADDIIRQGGTLTQQLEKAKGLEGKLRDQVEQRLEHNAAVEERAQREASETASRQAYDLIDRSSSVDAIPPAQWASFDGSQRSAMIHYARLKAEGVPVETDYPTYYALMDQAGKDPQAFLKQNLMNYRAKLSDVEFKQLAGLQLSVRNGEQNALEKNVPGFRTKQEIVDDTLVNYGIDPRAKPTSAEGKAIANLRRLLDQRIEAVQSDGKTKVTNVEIQQALDDILGTQVTTPGSWWGLLPGHSATLREQKRRAVDMNIDDVPADKRQRIEQRLRQRGLQPTDANILDWYIDTLTQGAAR